MSQQSEVLPLHQKKMTAMANISRVLVGNASKVVKHGWSELFHPHNIYLGHGFAGISTYSEPAFAWGNGHTSSKVLVSHSFCKPKAALIIQPKGPQFAAVDSGGITLAKEGAMFFSFVPAIGVQKYDMNKKQTIAVTVSELGSLLSLGPHGSCEFLHDPFMGKSEAGRIRKLMKVEPFPDRTGYYFMLMKSLGIATMAWEVPTSDGVADRLLNIDHRLLVPITKGEFAVMHTAFNFIVPYIMGWHMSVDSSKHDGMMNPPVNSDTQTDYDLVWDG